MVTADVVRIMLIVDMVGMALLAIVYLWQRQMSRVSFFCWGLLALLVPVLGPFMVIASRPGQWDPSFSVSDSVRNLYAFAEKLAHKLLPVEPPKKRKSHAERVRERRQTHR